MDKLINKVGKDIAKAAKDNKAVLTKDKVQDKKIATAGRKMKMAKKGC